MATLNVKNFPDVLYRKLKARARRQRRSIAQEVALILAESLAEREPMSIQALQGLGREYWEGTDAVAHVERERREWD